MTTQTVITRRAPVAATTWNAEARTFQVVFSTGAGVERRDARGAYVEILSLDQDWPEQVPLLDGHRRESLDNVLGVATHLRVVDGEALADVRLSRHSPLADRLAAELTDGATFGVSVGYTVEGWKETSDPATGRRAKVASRWTPVEVSIVPIPADRSASIRGSVMTTRTEPDAAPDAKPAATIVSGTFQGEIRTKSADEGDAGDDNEGDAGATPPDDETRAARLASMRTRSHATRQVRTTASVGTDHADPEVRSRSIGEALYTRVNPGHQPSEQARAYIGLTIPEIARDILRTRSISTTGLSPAAVIERALHSTSDFPIILGDAVGRTLREAYGAAPSGVRQLGRQTTARDFRAKHRIQLSAAPTLEKVNEAGEFKSGSMGESKESYKIDTFGRIIGITRQALVNDDLGAFTDLSRRMGQAAAAFEADFLVNLVREGAGAGPVMSDGKRLFHADHGNLAGAGAAISETTLSAARLALRRQTGLKGELISVTPRYLVVSPENETIAEKTVSAIQATKVDDANVFTKLVVVVEPRFTGNAWYLTADPGEIDGLEYAYLEGEPGPQITTQAGFTVDGVQIRIRLDFGAGFVDHRGWFRNPGQ
ncbi:MAG: Mu-like prophage major head subunit gpT family protein [Proteobacteria bacterium]|nr:Mu-like prophage major head subunit gpT family protein [Pseudomonadota bacterium]